MDASIVLFYAIICAALWLYFVFMKGEKSKHQSKLLTEDIVRED